MKRKRLKLLARRTDPEFELFLRDHAKLDPVTDQIKVEGCYACLGFNVQWSGKLMSMTYANAVWFLNHGRWPKAGYHIDHINDDALDNRPENLQELTQAENQRKRRGRIVSRHYGKGKYGYGLYILHDKRDDRYYVSRNLSRGHGKGDLQAIKYSLGGFYSKEEAEVVIASHIEELKIKGLAYIPPVVRKNMPKTTTRYDMLKPQMREMRSKGMTFQAIADTLGVRMGIVYRRTRHVPVKKES